ncbi:MULTISPECIES: head-tail adaptor protein [Pseudolactococcus]|uniref:head-tail adaptor protein n=1 Tax=Pseudolactococcus TaxID=3436058 RepID=UPI00077BFC5C|nr:head-tail adaptor protein [Lactococcus raffinolactis]HBZ59665.1 head-tail adaptor protein [Lactococcus sp.]
MPLIKNVNELTSRIHFKQPKYGKNKIGDTVVIGYEDKATIWGKVLKRSVTNTYTGGANWADNKVQVAIRHYQKNVISHGDYLTFDSDTQTYSVKEIYRDVSEKEYDTLVCEEVKGKVS